MSYCQDLAEQPANTVVATVSDFAEGGAPSALIHQARDMISSGIIDLSSSRRNKIIVAVVEINNSNCIRSRRSNRGRSNNQIRIIIYNLR